MTVGHRRLAGFRIKVNFKMPRKAEDNAEDAAPPRRSTRIASAPVAKVTETLKTAVKKVTGTKRSTAGGDESKTKKVRDFLSALLV